ncbi:MAG: UvrB/UvrC motif-containing protein [Candidatus Omnitrophota bacterium]
MMLCDICSKNPATVHLTEIIDDQISELHLCEDCARQKSAEMEQQFGLSSLLGGMAEAGKPAAKEKETAIIKCPNCQLTYADFKRVGRLGCGDCYVAFKKFLAPLLKRIHGSNQHFGKSPSKVTRAGVKGRVDLGELRDKLQRAIETEAFEEAARIRDQIKESEKEAERQNSQDKEKNESQ